MNNGNENEKNSTNIFSNNRGNNNTIIVLAPVIIMGGAFAIFLMFVGGLVFFIVNRAGFLAFMPNVFTGFIELVKWALIVGLAIVVIKFVAGGFIEHVLGGFIKHVVEPLRKARVLHANDNFMAYTGNVNVSHHQDVRQNYNIKTVEGPQEPVALIEAPKRPSVIPARSLYDNGTLLHAIQADKIIMGWGEKGQLLRIARKQYFSAIAGGIPSSGKTTTAFWVIVQQILIGAKLILVDPHMNYESEDGEKSLTQELSAFSSSFLFPPCDASLSGPIMQRVKHMKNLIDQRKRPGYIVKASDTVLMVFDEANSVFDMEEIRDELAADLAYIQREGRKFNVHTMIIGHRWSRDDIGKVQIRTVASTIMAHKQNDENQAGLLVGRSNAKKVLELTPGTYLYRSINPLRSKVYP